MGSKYLGNLGINKLFWYSLSINTTLRKKYHINTMIFFKTYYGNKHIVP